MSISLTNSKDIYANSVSVMLQKDDINITDIISGLNKFIFLIVGNAPDLLHTLEMIAVRMNNESQVYQTLLVQINDKAQSRNINPKLYIDSLIAGY